MPVNQHNQVTVPPELIEAIKSFPVERELNHCGATFGVPPFELYATCPHCGTRLKLRAFSAGLELEDVFDAFFEWMNNPEAQKLAEQRQQALALDS